MKRWLLPCLCAVALTAVCTGGCKALPWEKARVNIENSKRLRVGMTKNEVLEIMGEPVRNEMFCQPDLWYYYIEPNWVDGLTTEDECMPLLFENGKLVGWGRDFYARFRRDHKDRLPKLTANDVKEGIERR